MLNLTNEQKRYVLNVIENIREEESREPYYKGLRSYSVPIFTYFDGVKWQALNRQKLLSEEFEEEELPNLSSWAAVFKIPGSMEHFKEVYPHSGIEAFNPNYSEAGKESAATIKYMNLYVGNPSVEQVVKVASELVRGVCNEVSNSKAKLFNTNFKKGKNLKEITGLPDWLWKKLVANNVDLDSWHEMRIWYKETAKEGKPLTVEEVDKILELSHSLNLAKVRKIVKTAKNSEGKKIFTPNSLVNYLRRVDMYQAIEPRDAVEYLADYIRMCNELKIEPLTDSNSLKREHDVTARTYNNWKRENILAQEKEGFKDRYDILNKYSYSDDKLSVIVPKTPMDMVEEGKMNRNCVGCYTSSYAEGRSTVFFIRKNDDLEHSYITIETDGTGENLRQAFYACNRKIDNQNDLNFINSWIKHNKQINASC